MSTPLQCLWCNCMEKKINNSQVSAQFLSVTACWKDYNSFDNLRRKEILVLPAYGADGRRLICASATETAPDCLVLKNIWEWFAERLKTGKLNISFFFPQEKKKSIFRSVLSLACACNACAMDPDKKNKWQQQWSEDMRGPIHRRWHMKHHKQDYGWKSHLKSAQKQTRTVNISPTPTCTPFHDSRSSAAVRLAASCLLQFGALDMLDVCLDHLEYQSVEPKRRSGK